MEDDKTIAIVSKEAWVGSNGFPNIVKGMLASVHPDVGNWIGILALSRKLTKRNDPEFEVVDVFAVELSKANEFGDIVNYLR